MSYVVGAYLGLDGRAHPRKIAAGLISALSLLFLGSCAELPAIGPTIGEVEDNGASYSTNPFVIVEVDKGVVATLNSQKKSVFTASFESKAPAPDLRIGVGDILQLNVLEQSPSLFSPPSGQSPAPGPAAPIAPLPMNMQPVQVGNDGAIVVPFAGRILAAGRTAESVRAEIERRLANKAIFPQVQLTVANPIGLSPNSATVGGEVNKAGVFPLQSSGNRLLDLIAEGGGPRFPPYETTVFLTRRGRKAEVSLQTVVENPKQNIFVYPHDSVYLARNLRTFTVLGASTKVGRYNFDTAHVSLAEAVAMGGGFVDAASNPAGVYVFRYEPSTIVRAMKPDLPITAERIIPVLYRVNLRDGGGYFLSTQFEMCDKDVVLLATSEGAQFQKLLNILESASSIGLGVKGILQQNSVVLSPASTSGVTAPAQ